MQTTVRATEALCLIIPKHVITSARSLSVKINACNFKSDGVWLFQAEYLLENSYILYIIYNKILPFQYESKVQYLSLSRPCFLT